MRTCENCRTRKAYAKVFDAHFDWRDCPYECEYAKEREKEEKERSEDPSHPFADSVMMG